MCNNWYETVMVKYDMTCKLKVVGKQKGGCQIFKFPILPVFLNKVLYLN